MTLVALALMAMALLCAGDTAPPSDGLDEPQLTRRVVTLFHELVEEAIENGHTSADSAQAYIAVKLPALADDVLFRAKFPAVFRVMMIYAARKSANAAMAMAAQAAHAEFWKTSSLAAVSNIMHGRPPLRKYAIKNGESSDSGSSSFSYDSESESSSGSSSGSGSGSGSGSSS